MQVRSEERIWTKSFISLSFTQFILYTVFYSLLTTLPIYVIDQLGGTKTNAGLVVTFMLASAILVRPFSAKILDVVGKKKALILSMALFALTTFFYLTIKEFIPLLVLRFIHGISLSIVTTSMSAIAADIVPKARRGTGMGYFALAMNLAIVAGPFIGLTLLQFYSFHVFFIVLSILAIIGVLCTFIVQTGETPKIERLHKSTFALKFTDLLEPKAIPIAIISGLVGVAYATILSFVPVYAEEIGLEATASYFFLVFAVVMMVFRPFLGRAFDEKGARFVLVPSLLIFSVSLTVLGFTTTSSLLLIAAALVGLGYGTLLPGFQTVAIQSTDNHRSGHAIATFFIFYDIGIATGAIVWGIVVGVYGYETMFFIGAVLVAITAGILYGLLSKNQKKQTAN